MNTAFLDAQNLAWKLHAVESGFADRALLQTYEPERHAVAEALLNFDNQYAKLFSQRLPAATEVQAASKHADATPAPTPTPTTTITPAHHHHHQQSEDNDFIRTFKESCAFTSGYGVAYAANLVNWSPPAAAAAHPLVLTYPHDTRLRPGHLFINADVTRVVDANVVHLEQQIPLNGAFRIFVFAGTPPSSSPSPSPSTTTPKPTSPLHDFATHLFSPNPAPSFLTAHLRPDIARVSRHEVLNPHSRFFTFCTIMAAPRASIEISRDVPSPLARYRDLIFADDRWDRRVPDAAAAAHAKMGFDPAQGGVVVVRPDGYVGVVVRLVEGSGTVDVLNAYFDSFCVAKLGRGSSGAGMGASVGFADADAAAAAAALRAQL